MDDEEMKQSQNQQKTIGNQLKKGAKDQAKKLAKKIIKKIVMMIMSLLLKVLIPVLIVAIIITAIADFLHKLRGNESKDADAFAVHYTGGAITNGGTGNSSGTGGNSAEENIPNQIIVDFNNRTENGAYKLTYKFTDENGNVYTGEEEAILNAIKRDIKEGNLEIDVSQFTDAELRIIGSLMYNGVEVKRYNEEELRALVVFVKAGIASQSFDLRPAKEIGQAVDMETIQTSDEVYGTIQVQKTKIEEDSDGKLKYNEIKLEYISYNDFHAMDEQDNVELLNKFSINEEGNLVVARKTETETTYDYVDENEKKLSEEDIEKIPEEYKKENVPLTITVDEVKLERKQFNTQISKFIMNYGLLSDLLIVTQNVDFCLELAELAFNSKIVINVKEQKSETEATYKTNYTQTNLLYDYVDYEVSKDPLYSFNELARYEEDPRRNLNWRRGYNFPNTHITSSLPVSWIAQERETISITCSLNYDSENEKWVLYGETSSDNKEVENLSQVLIENKYEEQLNEKYTADELFKYTIVEKLNYKSTTNYFEISEVDTWYAKYKKQYQDKTPERKTTPSFYEGPENTQYTEEAEVILDTSDETQINSDEHVTVFINEMKNQAPNTDIDYTVNHLTVKQKVKTVSKTAYDSKTTKDNFEDNNADTTQVQLKNIEYINDNATFTSKDSVGFLSIYDKYRKSGVDLYLQDDAEKKLFELLESDQTDVITWSSSNTIKNLLSLYDGMDRGGTDLNIKVFNINLGNVSGSFSPFGCKITREEFIQKAQEFGDSLLSNIAGDFYDVCTQEQYNINPCLAYAWAAEETGWGEKVRDCNLFGMAVYNGQNSGTKYNSYAESIEDFCRWVVNVATPGTNAYNLAYDKAQEFATVNSKFNGTPEKNGYVLFSRYMDLGDTHIADEPDFNNPAGIKYYEDHGSTWGAGGRIHIYVMYEEGGLYKGEYATRCGHVNGTDPTTLQEKADYVQYSIEDRIKIAKTVFGNNCLVGGNIVDAAYAVADHFMNSGVDVYYPDHKSRHCVYGDIQGAWNKPLEEPDKYGVVCATYVSLALWYGNFIDEETINQYAYNWQLRSRRYVRGSK